VLDSSSSSASSVQLGAAPAPKPAHGAAHGSPAIEIFTSFRALVDSLADGKEKEKDPTATSGAEGQTGATGEVVVMPLDIAALLLPHLMAAKGTGGATPRPQSTNDDRVLELGETGDLTALLLGARGLNSSLSAPGGASAAGDAGGLDDAGAQAARQAAVSLGASNSVSVGAAEGDAADGAALAQAVIQRLLAAATAGSQKLATDLASEIGLRQHGAVEELLQQIVGHSDTATSSVLNPSARLMTPHAGEFHAASVRALAADAIVPANQLLEPPSTAQVDQIVQAIRLQWSRGGGEAQIRLEPRQFGNLTVSVRVDHGQVVARLQADTPIVREWLQANQQLLRQSLGEHNLTLSRLEVSEPGDARPGTSRDGKNDGEPSDGRQTRRPRTPETGETFEVVV